MTTITETKLEYCWAFRHPKHGWIGGGDDDIWGDESSTRSSASYSEYETKIISRPKQKQAMPGSVKPSIRST